MAQKRGLQASLRLIGLLVLVLGLLPLVVEAARPNHLPIVGNVTWSTNQALTTDVVVTNGATLTIKNVTVTAGTPPDPGEYGAGLSPKIEILVETGGTLNVESGATLTAGAAGDWYGVVFLAGSGGTINGATIRNGTVGITVYDASPTIRQNTITDMQGDHGGDWGAEGQMAAGIVISGTSTTQVISNTLSHITGGNGTVSPHGGEGAAPLPWGTRR